MFASATPAPRGRLDTDEQRNGSSHEGSLRSSRNRSWSSKQKVWLWEGPEGGTDRDAASKRSIKVGGSVKGEAGWG